MTAFLINEYGSLDIYGAISIYMGSVAALLSLLVLPLRLSLAVFATSVLTFYLQISSTSFALVQAAEYLFVLAMIRLKVRFLIAVFSYWIFIGFPAVFGIFLFDHQSIQTALFVAVTIGLNGFVCGIFAIFIFWFVPSQSQFRAYNPVPPRFAKVVFELCIVSVILPTVLVTLVFTWRSTQETEKQLNEQLLNAAFQVDSSISERLSHNLHSVKQTAVALNKLDNPDEAHSILNLAANGNADIESMIVVDQDGFITALAPEKYARYLPTYQQKNISEREYFARTKQEKTAYVSDVIEGQGIGTMDIVAATAPLFKDGAFTGIVQGATKLDTLLDERVISRIEGDGIALVLTDSSGVIVYSSKELLLEQLDSFDLQPAFHMFLRQAPALNANGLAFMYGTSSSEFGWQIYALAPPTKVFRNIVNYFLYIGITFLISVLLVGLLAKRLSAIITKPLVNLERFLAGKVEGKEIMPESTISIEMVTVTNSLIDAKQVAENFQAELKQQVSDKTQELQGANEKLLYASQIDALTGIYNRGAFDDFSKKAFNLYVREKTPFSVVLIDIDHFKKVNDNFGHMAGDECIVKVAKALLDTSKRDSDIIARYGGEEYIMMLSGTTHFDYVEAIRKEIEAAVISVDGNDIKLTISAGIVTINNDFSLKLEKLISLTDELLYDSKRNGRNQTTHVVL
ncbi:diguanylate cyclase [Glaciecola sp. MH2013]|uniref:sensor domain-containing diguanylate cyclase n=1 Tax=Glaciecola sp. MH2013 TaxID=2785524 RepID=UPI00189F0FA0|nr:diguanylate cyclase [Glaciecola sp. MH2013]MBF7074264.1 diguanylate cyclase [Glaciecola sp. MH2013]